MSSRTTLGASLDAVAFKTAQPIILGGLVVGALLGFGGNFVEPGEAQDVLYGLSAAGLIVASVLLVLEHLSTGHRFAAAGFALLALGETRVLNPADVPGGEASFAAGVLLYAPGLLLIAASTWAPLWARVTGAVAAVAFATHSVIYLGGGEIDSTGPVAGIGYTLLTITVMGWILAVLRSQEPAPAPARPSEG